MAASAIADHVCLNSASLSDLRAISMTIDDAERQRIIEAIRTYMARERISREEFAQRAKLGKSTIDKLATGLFSERTILQIEARLNIKLRDSGASTATAPAEYGSYTREEASYFIGEYVFARPCFQEAGVIQAFQMEIVWAPKDNVLILQEPPRGDEISPQAGRIHIPRGSNHIFVVSNENGWLQTVILSQLNVLKRMKGMMLTMGHAFANIYSPVAVPVIMNKQSKIETHMVGRIAPGSAQHRAYQAELVAVEAEGFARWVRPS
jgi:transcriptional regulator with XRE-family HTH domain